MLYQVLVTPSKRNLKDWFAVNEDGAPVTVDPLPLIVNAVTACVVLNSNSCLSMQFCNNGKTNVPEAYAAIGVNINQTLLLSSFIATVNALVEGAAY